MQGYRSGTLDLPLGDPPVDVLFAATPAGMAVFAGADSAVTLANDAFHACAGRPDGAAARPDGRVRTLDGLRALAREVLRSGRTASLSGLEGEDGGRWDASAVLLNGAGGAPGAVLMTVQDVTETVRAREEAERRAALAEEEQRTLGLLMRDVNHRVKNSLQLVSSLLTLQALSVSDPRTRHQFQESCGRVGTIAQIYQRLHASRRFEALDFGAYLRDLGQETTRLLQRSIVGRAVLVTAEPLDLPTDTAIPLALIVNELINNALAHAYAAGEPGDVEVRFAPSGDTWRLTVADHGRGLPAGFDATRVETLGIKVVRALVAQIRGRLTVGNNRPGALIDVELPA